MARRRNTSSGPSKYVCNTLAAMRMRSVDRHRNMTGKMSEQELLCEKRSCHSILGIREKRTTAHTERCRAAKGRKVEETWPENSRDLHIFAATKSTQLNCDDFYS